MQHLPPLQPGLFYHIYNRGINRGNIFFEERNYRHFMELYAKHVEAVADTLAYCLMRNHFHLLVRIEPAGSPPTSNPTQSFSNLFNAYAKGINKADGRTGSLFEGRFGRIPVTGQGYLQTLITYFHRNPQKHGFVQDFREYPYSSYSAVLSPKATHIKREVVLAWFGSQDSFITLHQSASNWNEIRHLVQAAESFEM